MKLQSTKNADIATYIKNRDHICKIKATFIFLKHFFQARKYSKNNIRHFTSFSYKIFKYNANVIFKTDFSWINHIFKNRNIGLFIYLRIVLHNVFVLNCLFQDIKALLNKLKIRRWFTYITDDSLNNRLDNMDQFII